MADVIIKGMEMPKRCADCWMMDGEDSWCSATRGKFLDGYYRYGIKDRPDWCPLRPAPEWISVEDRLPPKSGGKVLACWTANGEQVIDTAFFTPGGWNAVHWKAMTVTHWMPLPEPPEGGDGDA